MTTKMKQFESFENFLPNDIALNIASCLVQVSDVCALGSCSRLWKELCESDFIWASLYRNRWSLSLLLHDDDDDHDHESSIETSTSTNMGWKSVYVKKHKDTLERANTLVNFVDRSESIEVREYLVAIKVLCSMDLGFKDVQMFLFKPNLNVLLNLVCLHYCIKWLGISAECVTEALQSCKISERQVCVKWWTLGRWFHGFRLRDESHSRLVSLGDIAMEDEVLGVLQRGAVHEVLRVQISVANPPCTRWSFQRVPI